MVRNTMGGKKAKKMKNSGPVKRATEYATEDQYYAIVEKFHSHSNIDVCFVDKDEDGKEHLVSAIGILRGKIIKRVKRVAIGDICIISKRDFATVKLNEKQKVDILHKYNNENRNEIIRLMPSQLKSFINTQSATLNRNKVDNNSDDDDYDIIFQRENEEKEERKRIRQVKGPRNNTITNDYLAGFDIPESDDDFSTDEEEFEGNDKDYQNKLIDNI